MINTGLSLKYIYAIKTLLALASTGLFVILLDAFRKKKRKRLWIVFPVFLLTCASTILVFSLNLRSKEEIRDFNKRKTLSLNRGEKIISFIEMYSKAKGLYPKKISSLKSAYPQIKLTDGWGNEYVYSSNGITFRLSFAIPGDKGYYFYNSATGSGRYQGYLFKYMHGEIIK